MADLTLAPWLTKKDTPAKTAEPAAAPALAVAPAPWLAKKPDAPPKSDAPPPSPPKSDAPVAPWVAAKTPPSKTAEPAPGSPTTAAPPLTDQISQAEKANDIPAGLLTQVLHTESGFDPSAVNKEGSGATGIAQIMPATAKDPGYGIKPVDPNDPRDSVRFAGEYLAALKKKTGSWEGAIRAYGSLASTVGTRFDAAPQNPRQASLLAAAQSADGGQSASTGFQQPRDVARKAPDSASYQVWQDFLKGMKDVPKAGAEAFQAETEAEQKAGLPAALSYVTAPTQAIVAEAGQVVGTVFDTAVKQALAVAKDAGMDETTRNQLEGDLNTLLLGSGGDAANLGLLHGKIKAELEAKAPPGTAEAFDKASMPADRGGPTITVHHGSPHQFQQFDTAKVGTGEGSQARGHGLYFAEEKSVAQSYADTVKPGQAFTITDKRPDGTRGDTFRVIDGAGNARGEFPTLEAAQAEADKLFPKAPDAKGHIYTSTIHGTPDEFLHWDKPLSEQSQHVKDAIAKSPEAQATLKSMGDDYRTANPSGEDLYRGMSEDLGKDLEVKGQIPMEKLPEADARASKALNQAGIKGNRYADAGSRGVGEGTHNYVVFNHDDVSITHVNGEHLSDIVAKSKPETIVGVAVKAGDRTFTGPDHTSAIKAAEAAGIAERDIKAEFDNFGFLTSSGRFVDAEEASKIAGLPHIEVDSSKFGIADAKAREVTPAGKPPPTVPPEFTAAAEALKTKTPSGHADPTALWFLDGDKPVFDFPNRKAAEQVLGNRVSELDQYSTMTGKSDTGSPITVWYKPGEEARAQKLIELAKTTPTTAEELARYHRETGLALGYSPESVNAWVAADARARGGAGGPPAGEPPITGGPPGEPPGEPPLPTHAEIGATQTDLADRMHAHNQGVTADRIETREMGKAADKVIPRDPALREKLIHHQEQPGKVPLTSEEQAHFDNHVLPIIRAREEVQNKIADLEGKPRYPAWPALREGEDISHAPRFVKDKGSTIDWLLQGMGRRVGARSLSKVGDKARTVAGPMSDNPKVAYYKDAVVNNLVKLEEAKRQLRNMEMLEHLKGAPELEHLREPTHPSGWGQTPGWKAAGPPQLAGLHWHPRIANAIDDAFKDFKRSGDAATFYQHVNRLLVGSMFYSPWGHVLNVIADTLVSKGAVGSVVDAVTLRSFKAFGKAVREVTTLGKDYRANLRAGSSLQYGATKTENFVRDLVGGLDKHVKADPKSWAEIAKAGGYANPANLVAGIYRASRQLLWGVGDVLKLTRQYELEAKGMSRAEAIKETEKHIVSYRVPTEVVGSRMLSEVFQSPHFSFGRYHYGLLKSLATTARDLVKGTPAERMRAMDSILMMGAVYLGYQVADEGVRKLTGHKDASFRRSGIFGLEDVVEKAVTGDKDARDVLQRLASVNPALKMLATLYEGKDPYTGRDVIRGRDLWEHPGRFAKEIATVLGGGLVPFKKGMDLATGKTSPQQAILSELGVSDPGTSAQRAKALRMRADRQLQRRLRRQFGN